MTKRMTIMLIIAALVFGGIFAFQVFKARMIKKFMTAAGIPPQTVSTVVAQETDWQAQVEAVGSLRASQGANLAAETGGLVTQIHFDSGQFVRAGTVLVELNAAPDIGKLESLKAAADLADVVYKRDLAQLKVQAVSQATVDTDAANLKNAKALVVAQQAAVDQKIVRAPFSGRLGIRQIDLGQYLAPGTPIVTLQALDPMYVDFTVPQRQIFLIKTGQKVDLQTNALLGKKFSGTISAIEPLVDTNTRNLKVRARIPNAKGDLLPGMFASVHIDQGEPQRFVTLPNAAIAYNPYGSTVFLVEEKPGAPGGKPALIATQRFVTTGLTRGDQVAVLSGIKGGETVVTAGQLKLRNGVPVVVNNKVQPSDNPNPTVIDE
jgi:membrane fusion protein (multidrug efflux system)